MTQGIVQRHHETANAARTYDQIRAIAQPGQRHFLGGGAGHDRSHLVNIGWNEQEVRRATTRNEV
jgi:hypothetical protein